MKDLRFKFRVWKGLENRMVDNVTHLNPLLLDESLSEEAKYNVLMQCTGLKDKNGKLIYEGDVLYENWKNEVFPNGKKWVVKWNNNNANFYIDIINPSKNITFNQWHLTRHDLDYEVIGNIYMDSHLLDISNNL